MVNRALAWTRIPTENRSENKREQDLNRVSPGYGYIQMRQSHAKHGKGKKAKLSLQQAVKSHMVARRRSSHIF
jgi:hypothetical protein